MRNDQIIKIRNACIIANPSIMDVGSGCMIRVSGKLRTIIKSGSGSFYLDRSLYGSQTIKKHSEFDILGRQIHAGDLMCALMHRYNQISESLGFLLQDEKDDLRDGLVTIACQWNHSEILESQSDDSIRNIAMLFK